MQPVSFFTTLSPGEIDGESAIVHGVSVLTVGPAKGWPFEIDRTTLLQVMASAQREGQVKVKAEHWSGVSQIIGYIDNFSIEEGTDGDGLAYIKLRGDLHFFQSRDDWEYWLDLCETLPGSIGLSVACAGSLYEDTVAGKAYLRCSDLRSIDLVDEPAANPEGLLHRGPGGCQCGQAPRGLDKIRTKKRCTCQPSAPVDTPTAASSHAASAPTMHTQTLESVQAALSQAQTQLSTLTADRDGLKTKNGELTTQLSAVTADRDGLKTKNGELTTQLSTVTADRDTLKTQNGELTTQLSTLTAERDELAERDSDIGQRAAEVLAKHGLSTGPRKQAPAKLNEPEVTTLSRGDFDKLQPEQQEAFFSAGGKLLTA